jgi:hypothetical protein
MREWMVARRVNHRVPCSPYPLATLLTSSTRPSCRALIGVFPSSLTLSAREEVELHPRIECLYLSKHCFEPVKSRQRSPNGWTDWPVLTTVRTFELRKCEMGLA